MVTSASLAVYLVELVKSFMKWILKEPSYEFNPKFMAALLVVANAGASLLLAVLGVEGYSIPTDWLGWSKALVLAILGALVSSAVYVMGYAPFKFYVEDFRERHFRVSKPTKRVK
jgi:drug/metabolite transporter (DMT)-like permease